MSYLLSAIPLLLSFLLVHADKDQCANNDPTKCLCIKSDEYEFQCPLPQTKILIRTKPKEFLKIDCFNTDHTLDIDVLPNYKSGNTSTVNVRFCQMEQDNFAPLLEKLDVRNVQHFYLENMSLPVNASSGRLAKNLFAGLPGLDTLTISRVPQKMDVDFLEYLPNLTHLYLENDEIDNLDDFKFPSTIQVLHITGNQLTEVPKNIFNNLTVLRQLHLWVNNISKIYRDDFTNLKSLRSLELSSNAISSIEEDSFADLTELKTISFRENRLTKINSSMFKYNKNLIQIRLEFNRGLILSERMFADLPNLQIVKLANCGLDTVPENIFENSHNLLEILMGNNRITNIPENLFKQLSKLNTLDLRNNNIGELPDEIFSDLKELRNLNLDNNSLTHIDSDLFQSMENLVLLSMANNKISTISKEAFFHLKKLKELILYNNKLTFHSFDFPFANCLNLTRIILNNNLIEEFPPLDALIALKEINLSYNKIKTIQGSDLTLFTCPSLRSVDLSNNLIDYIDLSIVESQIALNRKDLDALHASISQVDINLNNNPLRCDCGNYFLIRYFQDLIPDAKSRLNINADEVKCAGPEWYTDVNIMNLRPQDVYCRYPFKSCPKECECYWRPFTDYLEMDCSNRNLTYFPKLNIFPVDKRHDIQINLNGNAIRGGLNAESGYENVKELFLSNNNLEEMKWIPLGIEVLKLDGNNLTKLEPELIDIINKANNLTTLTLSNNPWKCGCSARDLQIFMTDHYTKVNSKDVICEDHKYLIEKTELCKQSSTLIMIIVLPVVALLLLTVITLVFYIYYRQEVKVWLFAKNICLWFVTEEELDEDKKYDIFISYSNVDEEFVMQNLVSVLESGPKPFKTCIHIRDFEVGEMIMTNITNSVLNSRRTLVVLSNSFLDSVWGIHEFKMAHTQAIKEGRARVVVVKLGDLDESKLDDDLKSYLNTNTYVEWGTPWFWKNLMYALPHSRKKRGGFYKSNQKHADIMLKIDDKYGLTSPPLSHPESTPPVITLDPALLKNHPLNFHKSNAPSSETPLVVDA